MRNIIDVGPRRGNQKLSERNTPPIVFSNIQQFPYEANVLKDNGNKNRLSFHTKLRQGHHLTTNGVHVSKSGLFNGLLWRASMMLFTENSSIKTIQ